MSNTAATTPSSAALWRVRGRVVRLDRPFVLGVVNVTPDSFSDGGAYLDPLRAVEQAERLVAQGADGIDVGGESTRPQGATPVDADEERRRVVPVIEAIVRQLPDTVVSVDTVKAETARAALDAGAGVVNDVSAFRLDARMASTCADARCGVVLMHSRGDVATMGTYRDARYDRDPAEAVRDELSRAAEAALAAGVSRDAVVLDPGLGFAKRSEHSLRVLGALPRLAGLGYPVLVGASRKRFIGEITGVAVPSERVAGTVGACVLALARGAMLFRVHDVAPARQALDVAWAAMRAGGDAALDAGP